MTYNETINYLFTRLPMFSKLGAAAYKKDLTNTVRLLEFLDNPHTKFRTIHVGGTNGKGSTCHMLAAIFQTAGYKTGLYTSPHLKDFRERIRIDGRMITQEFVVDFVERFQSLINEIEPSFFEITVAMAFDYFHKQLIDIAIVEVGLGGRLDSTNIIEPELAIITNIGWDHMNLLGNSLEEIAMEKAGIIKSNVPILIGESSPESKPIFEATARHLSAPITFADDRQYVSDWKHENSELIVEIADKENDERHTLHLDLPGLYQVKNLVTVLQAVKILKNKWKISFQHIQKALQRVKKLTGLHGRWETIHRYPQIVLEVGHNADGIRQVVAQIELTEHKDLHIVIGLVKDKEIEKILSLLPKNANYYFTKAQIQRALPEEILAMKASEIGLTGNHYPEVNAALRAAVNKATEEDLIVVCGSVYLVGEVESKFEVRSSKFEV